MAVIGIRIMYYDELQWIGEGADRLKDLLFLEQYSKLYKRRYLATLSWDRSVAAQRKVQK